MIGVVGLIIDMCIVLKNVGESTIKGENCHKEIVSAPQQVKIKGRREVGKFLTHSLGNARWADKTIGFYGGCY